MKFLLVLPVVLATAYGWLSDCGRSKYPDAGESGFGIPYVVGGREARQGEYPYQVSLRRMGSHFCGGVIINNNWVLSAAHCTTGESVGDVTVAVGQHVRSDDGESTKVIHSVSRIIDHENYDGPTISNDISLLRMNDAITMNDDVQPACRPNEETYEGQTGIVSGWGAIFSGGPGSDALRSALVHSIMSDDMCHLSFPGQIYPGMVCAGQLGSNPTDTCQGDSGGPMAVKNGGRFTIVGLTSWGRGCAGETPGVYARVSTYLGWINGHIGG